MSVMRLLDDIKRMQYHEVVVDLPEDFKLKGRMPFKMSVQGQQARFQVLALDEDLATERVYEFLNQLEEE